MLSDRLKYIDKIIRGTSSGKDDDSFRFGVLVGGHGVGIGLREGMEVSTSEDVTNDFRRLQVSGEL